MRFDKRLAMAGLVWGAAMVAQAPAANGTAATQPGNISAMLQPSLTQLHAALTALQPERWKLSRESRGAMSGDVRSIATDLSETLPALVQASDSQPASTKALFDVSQNVNALYDVTLRVTSTADVAAPEREAVVLADAVKTLQETRRALNDRVGAMIDAQHQNLVNAQAKLAAATAAAPQTPPQPVPCAPPVKKKRAAKPKTQS